jgi:hypothetical protein
MVSASRRRPSDSARSALIAKPACTKSSRTQVEVPAKTEETTMKLQRRWAFWFLLFALLVMLGIGFYLGVTHQEARPVDTNSPAATGPQG